MTTNWKILDTKRQTVDGVIVKVVYGCIVQLESFIDRTIGELELTGDASAEGFVPYESLTEATILEWVKSSLGQFEVNTIEASLQSSVTAQKAAKDAEVIKSGLPWRQ